LYSTRISIYIYIYVSDEGIYGLGSKEKQADGWVIVRAVLGSEKRVEEERSASKEVNVDGIESNG
jgi:hypothetical protein